MTANDNTTTAVDAASNETDPILDVADINTFYGTSHVLFDVSLSVADGESIALLGRNGVGKTTTLRSIVGVTPPRNGTITYRGEEIQGRKPNYVRRKGISWVPEDRRVFPALSVAENVELAASLGGGRGTEYVYERFPRLDERRGQPAGTLSGGEQQMLAIARALVGPETDVLLLDEPTEGLAPSIIETVKDIVQSLREEEGLTMILVEQNADIALELTDRAYVLSKGLVQLESNSDDLQSQPDLLERYLGAK